jgi:hypothetical protein
MICLSLCLFDVFSPATSENTVMNDSHLSLNPIYITKRINQPFSLYKGDIKFLSHSEDEDTNAQGIGIVRFDWLPALRLRYKGACHLLGRKMRMSQGR